MRITRLYTDQPLGNISSVKLDKHASNHILRVLRLKPGAKLVLFNGDGYEYPATLDSVQRNVATVILQPGQAVDRESPLQVSLVQGISRGERMDYTLQKAVELGVDKIIPVFTERTVVNLEGERLLKRHKHWQGIIISACEQCGRNIVPELSAPQTLHDWLNEVDDNLKLMLDPVGKLSFSVLEKPTGRVTLLVGPEGGLSDTEQGQLLSLGFKGVRMGPRILRTETAAVAALAALQTRWGDYN